MFFHVVRKGVRVGGLMAVMLGSLISFQTTSAATQWCFCWRDISVINPNTLQELSKKDYTYWYNGCQEITGSCDTFRTQGNYQTCDFLYNYTACADRQLIFEKDLEQRFKDAQQGGLAATKGGFIPKCALEDRLTDECKDVGVFVILAINVVNYLLSFIGALALAVFIYSGFVLILSQGNPEKVQKGKDAMMAAVLGLIVAFSGYALIQFLAKSLGVATGFGL